MSRRRYISTQISLDTKVNRLAVEYGDFAAILYTWMIPHAEDDGTITSDPEELMLQVIPGRRDKDVLQVQEAIEGMLKLGLIEKVNRADGTPRLRFPLNSFYKYQTYIPENKRSIASYNGNNEVQRESAKNAEENNFSPESAKNSVSPSPSPSLSLMGNDIYTPTDGEKTETSSHSTDKKSVAQKEIFDHWNSKTIIQHRKLTDQMRRAINGRLADYSVDEIKQAIDNYATILSTSGSFFTYKWTLPEFLRRGFEKFLDWETASSNYLRGKDRNGRSNSDTTGARKPSKWDEFVINS